MPTSHDRVTNTESTIRIFNRNRGFTKDPITYSVGVSNAMTMTIPVEAHRAKRQVLDPVFSKRRVNMMEDYFNGEIEKVFDRVNQFAERGEEAPIHELFYCYTVRVFSFLATRLVGRVWLTKSTLQADIVSELLFGKSLNMISAPDFTQRVKDMQFFTKGVWVALHFPILRILIIKGPRWLANILSATYIKMITVRKKKTKKTKVV